MLLAHLDGELNARLDARVRRHLQSCWQCRLHLAELSEQILEVTRVAEADTFPGSSRIAEAKQRFLVRSAALPSGSAQRWDHAWLRRLSPIWIAGGLALAATTGWLWHSPAPARYTHVGVPAPKSAAEQPPATVQRALQTLLAPARLERIDRAGMALLEVRVRYALHRSGLCMGEPIEVESMPNGRIQVRGTAPTEERRAAWLAALSSLDEDPRVQVDIATVEQALKNLEPAPRTTAEPAEAMAPAGEPPAQALLEKELAAHPDGAGRAAAARSNEILDQAERMLSHAWALRRLAERYDGNVWAARPEAAKLVERMTRDHRDGLRQQLALLHSTAGPVLDLLAGPSGGSILATPNLANASEKSLPVLFEHARLLHTALLHLFTSAGAGQAPAALARSALPEMRALGRTLDRAAPDQFAKETK